MYIADCMYVLTILLNLLQNTAQLPKPRDKFKEVDTCDCGRQGSDIANRIIGGQVIETNKFPWLVAIFLNGALHCGGSLINDRYILTAGHCLNKIDKKDIQLYLGEAVAQVLVKGKKKEGNIDLEIESTMIHEEFASDYLHDMEDIGLIKLKTPVKFSDKIRPICMPQPGSRHDSKNALVAGWGKTGQSDLPSGDLRRANLRVMKNEDCKNITSVGEHILDTMLCAYEQDADACQGDSGGPLMYENSKGKIEQIGIVSWGIGCAKPGVPGVYSRLTSYLDWLSKHTEDAVYCSSE